MWISYSMILPEPRCVHDMSRFSCVYKVNLITRTKLCRKLIQQHKKDCPELVWCSHTHMAPCIDIYLSLDATQRLSYTGMDTTKSETDWIDSRYFHLHASLVLYEPAYYRHYSDTYPSVSSEEKFDGLVLQCKVVTFYHTQL
jgi:hypothetical protein